MASDPSHFFRAHYAEDFVQPLMKLEVAVARGKTQTSAPTIGIQSPPVSADISKASGKNILSDFAASGD
jgi:hypothetical protein